MQEKYFEASEYFQRSMNYIKTIGCLDKIKSYKEIINRIEGVFKHKIPTTEKRKLIKKYILLELKSLSKML